jgi:hypothetical protein
VANRVEASSASATSIIVVRGRILISNLWRHTALRGREEGDGDGRTWRDGELSRVARASGLEGVQSLFELDGTLPPEGTPETAGANCLLGDKTWRGRSAAAPKAMSPLWGLRMTTAPLDDPWNWCGGPVVSGDRDLLQLHA